MEFGLGTRLALGRDGVLFLAPVLVQKLIPLEPVLLYFGNNFTTLAPITLKWMYTSPQQKGILGGSLFLFVNPFSL